MKTIKIALLIILLAMGDNLFAQTTNHISLPKDTTTREYSLPIKGTPGKPTGEFHIDDHGDKYPILLGPRGGKYYITKNNTKRYIRH